ncbi:MAG: CocE/NonD family hydrolase [Bryobacterales bacterium]|nr:CocE/NonD family hydrolase [Bryobacterales bacterium]
MRASKLAAVVIFCIAGTAHGQMVKDTRVRIRMRDGVLLAANVFRPAASGRFPAILIRTPYRRGRNITPNQRAFVEHGYAVVVQDVRGRNESEGVFRAMEQEPRDGEDTLNWIARQKWSNGRIGMMGGSYLGSVQWKAALSGNPYLKAIFPVVSGSDDYRDRFYSPGGAFKLGQRLVWISQNMRAPGFRPIEFHRYVFGLPLRYLDRAATGLRNDMYQQALEHPAYDSFWRGMSTLAHIERIRVPVYAVGGWYDNFVEGDLAAISALRKKSGLHRIMVGPWAHQMSSKFAGADFGPEAAVPLLSIQLEWFDQWLKGGDTALMSRAPVRIFVMGANRWREEGEWPPARVKPAAFYLDSRGGANSLEGDGVLEAEPDGGGPPDRFTYDPRKPVPTMGGAVCCDARMLPAGPMDQRPVERRKDVLVYTSPPLKQDLEVIGPVEVALYVSTSARDTDFTAKLVDVFPDGQARNLTDGILRLRYRDSLEKPAPAQPGRVYRIRIDAGVTGNVFLKGHRIRLEISSSNFPRFDRNPNTGRAIADERVLQQAFQTVYHDGAHPSHLLLPVLH